MATAKTLQWEGVGMYARIYWYASQAQFDDDLFGKSMVDWPKMKAGFEDVISRYPDSWNINNYAKFACLAKDKNKTSELFKRIGDTVVIQAWTRPLLEQCRSYAFSP